MFVSDYDPDRLVDIAERDGFPQNCCTWIKGIYGVCIAYGINPVICVTSGDCSNTIMLMEVLRLKGFEAIPFSYPDVPNVHRVRHSLETLAETLGTNLEAAESTKNEIASCRHLTHELDKLTWQDGLVSGWENHKWLVSSSDFGSDYHQYKDSLKQLLHECRHRQPRYQDTIRLAYIGVPPIFAEDLYRYLEWQGAQIVFNEVQRQFAMPEPSTSLPEQYANYTYPYSITHRIRDIIPELQRRRVDGVIHYVQSFCHRGIGDILFRETIDLPILTLEGNNDYILIQQTRTRIEAFLDMLRRRMQLSGKEGEDMKGNLYG